MKKHWTKRIRKNYQRKYYQAHHEQCVKDTMSSNTRRFINKLANSTDLIRCKELIDRRLNDFKKESEQE